MNLNETSSPFAVEVRVWPYSMCGQNDIKQTLQTRKGYFESLEFSLVVARFIFYKSIVAI